MTQKWKKISLSFLLNYKRIGLAYRLVKLTNDSPYRGTSNGFTFFQIDLVVFEDTYIFQIWSELIQNDLNRRENIIFLRKLQN